MASTGVNVANITQVKVGKIPTQAVGLQGEEGRSLLFSETTAQFGCYVVSIASAVFDDNVEFLLQRLLFVHI